MRPQRAFDLVLVTLTAPVWLPALGVLGLCLYAVDGGPVFFRQWRVGRDADPFLIWKFRTMTTEARVADRRPTRFGGWLRERGLDETAQVLNVLSGEMSLVGPRPLTREDALRLTDDYPPFARRFDVAPGVTGLAQIAGARGARRTAALEAVYLRRWSVATDLQILARTVWINLVGKRRGRRRRLPGTGSATG